MQNASIYLRSCIGRTIEELKKADLSGKHICFLVGADSYVTKEIVSSAAILPNSLGDNSSDNDTPPVPTVMFVDNDTFVKSTVSEQTEFCKPRLFVYMGKPQYRTTDNTVDEQVKLPLISLTNYVDVCGGLADVNMSLTKGNERTLCCMRNSFILIPAKSKPQIPSYIEPYTATVVVPYMDEQECCQWISLYVNKTEGVSLKKDSDGYFMAGNHDYLRQLYHCMRGMTHLQIYSVLKDCSMQLGKIYLEPAARNSSERMTALKKCIRKHADRIIENSRALIIENPSDNEPAGLSCLTKWLNDNRDQVANPYLYVKYRQEAPKGLLVSGVPGSGKSMMAKYVAGRFGLSLVRLDFGNLGGSYVGQSEKNMDSALAKIEALSPCVLWVDEMEKAFSGSSGANGSEVTKRLFGKFLTWMQEKGSRDVSCFVFATANDISKMPPEMFRSGRFDEKFFTFMPTSIECGKIFEFIVRKQTKDANRGENLQALPLFNVSKVNATLFEKMLNDTSLCLKGWLMDELCDKSVNRLNKFFTGADIEQVIKNAKNLFLNGFASDVSPAGDAEFDTPQFCECLREAIRETKTYGETNLVDIARCYAQLSVNNFKNASNSLVLPFDGYDELSYMSAENNGKALLYDLNRTGEKEDIHYQHLSCKYDKCMYVIVRNTINSISKEIIKQRWQ